MHLGEATMLYSKTMPQETVQQFLSLCKQLDYLTDTLGQAAAADQPLLVSEIRQLRVYRDRIASQYYWKPV